MTAPLRSSVASGKRRQMCQRQEDVPTARGCANGKRHRMCQRQEDVPTARGSNGKRHRMCQRSRQLACERARNTTAQHGDSGSSSSTTTRLERHSTRADQPSRDVSWHTCCLRLRRVTCRKRAHEEQNRQQRARARLAAKSDANNTKRHVQHSKWVGVRGSGRS